MSRSYKKTPYAGQKKSKFDKNYSNKCIRQTETNRVKLPDGNAYKKVYETWNICDFGWVTTWHDFQRRIRKSIAEYKNGTDSYSWKYYCSRFKMDPNTPDWKKLRWVWWKHYKIK